MITSGFDSKHKANWNSFFSDVDSVFIFLSNTSTSNPTILNESIIFFLGLLSFNPFLLIS